MEKRQLANGIEVRVEDLSQVLSGDLYMVRWRIACRVELGAGDEELRGVLGDTLVRETILEKPAVLDEVKRELRDSFLETNLPYWERVEYVERLKARTLKENREEEARLQRARAHD